MQADLQREDSGETSSNAEDTDIWAEVAGLEPVGEPSEADVEPLEAPESAQQTDAAAASEQQPSQPETETPAAQPQEAAAPQPAPDSQQPTQPVQPPATEEAPAPQAAQEAPQPPSAEDIAKLREGYVDTLMKERYAMDDDAVTEFESSPATYIPKAMAQLHANIVEEAIGLIMNRFPSMMRAQMSQIEAEQSNESVFFEKWPALKDPKFKDDLQKAGQVFKTLNPHATLEEFVKNVGLQVSITHGLPLDAVTTVVQTPPEPGVVASTTVAQTPTPRQVQQGFTPAAPGGGTGPVGQPTADENPWTALSREFDDL